LVIAVILALLLGPLTAFPTAQSMATQQAKADCVIELAAPLVELTWAEGPEGLAARSLMDNEQLSLRVSNRAAYPVWVELGARAIGGGADETTPLTKLLLRPLSESIVGVIPGNIGMRAASTGFSSQLLVTGRILDATGRLLDKALAPALFYHAEEFTGRLLVYTEEAQRERLRNGFMEKADNLFRDELINSTNDNATKTEAVGVGGAGIPIKPPPSQQNASASASAAFGLVKICVRLKVAFTDNGFGEDNWTTDSDKDARGVYVRVRDGNSTILFEGFTGDGIGDGDPGLGCTPWLYSTNFTNWSMRVWSKAKVQGNEILVYDNPDAESLVTWLITDMDPGASGTYAYSIPAESAVSSALAATSFALYRHAGGMSDKTYRVYTGADRNRNDDGKIYLSTNGSRRKFTVAHEMGHRLLRHKLGSNYNNDASYNAPGGPCKWDPDGHSMSSKEYNVGAFNEGFCHFYAADVWNDHDETDGFYKYYKTVWGEANPVIDVETGSKYMETTCSTPFSGYGNEMDWMRFFWDLHTDGSSKPTFTDIMNIIAAAGKLGDTTVFYDLCQGAAAYDGGVWLAKFLEKAAFNGVDH
jgi:hypothetical protein